MSKNLIILLLITIGISYEVPNMFYTFQLSWPGSICLTKQCYKENVGNYKGQSWAIHGLWPGATNDSGDCEELEACTNNKFKESNLSKTTMTNLDQAWVGFFNPSGSFRAHEWNKHGTCWDEKDDLVPQVPGMNIQEEYFQTTLQLWKSYNIYDILSAAGIKPDDHKFYDTDSILDAIENEIGSSAQLLCTKDSNNKLLLVSVSFCVDEKYEPQRCPCDVYGGIPCGSRKNDKVRYPVFRL
ncbi:unnamed protein product [Paramecium primaurelia]|uniref:Uncharacterized protein n=1 Tax=Paramecium primaurelia TaxID=5886 RepID=A0A8S1NKG7_PARPR|nr:unnamed protein product [Paramecium primaurelia]CAD8092602.1 unnamed protein product [Paramecium primaurelia]